MTIPELPNWVYDLVDSLDRHHEEHPKYYRYDGPGYSETECGCRVLDVVPAEIRAVARLLQTRRIDVVYTVGEGERGEGHHPVIALTSLEKARTWVRTTYGIELVERDSGSQWVGTRPGNDVDEVTVSRMPLRP